MQCSAIARVALMRALGQDMDLARCQEMVLEHARAHATIAVTVGLYHITFTATNAAAQRDGA